LLTFEVVGQELSHEDVVAHSFA